jgi:DNA-binding transcriptional LysR family regulator
VTVSAEGYDEAIRHGKVEDSRLVGQAAGSQHTRAGHVRRLPGSVRHAGVARRPGAPPRDHLQQSRDCRLAVPRRRDDGLGPPGQQHPRQQYGIVTRDAAIAGLGIALLPTFVVHAAIAAGELAVVDVGAKPEGAVVYIACAAGRRASAKVLALIDCLASAFDPPYRDRVIACRADPVAQG